MHNLLKIPDGGPPLTLGRTHIQSRSRLLKSGPASRASPSSPLPSPSSSFDSIATLDYCMRLSPAASSTVSVYWPVPRRRRQTSCNASSTQLHESYRTAASTTEDWPSSGATLYTGSTSPIGSGSGCACKCPRGTLKNLDSRRNDVVWHSFEKIGLETAEKVGWEKTRRKM